MRCRRILTQNRDRQNHGRQPPEAAAEAHRKAIGSIGAKGVTSAADYQAVNAAPGRSGASVQTSWVRGGYNAWAEIVNAAVTNKLFSTLGPLEAQSAAKALYDF